MVGGTKVFFVTGANVGFENLTIRPTHVDFGPGGGHGIHYAGASSMTGRPIVKNVAIASPPTSTGVKGGGAGIMVSGSANPVIGPNVTIQGGYTGVWAYGTGYPRIGDGVTITAGMRGIDVTESAALEILTSSSSPAKISGAGEICIRVRTEAASQAAAIDTHVNGGPGTAAILEGCGPGGGVLIDTASAFRPSRLFDLLIRGTPTGTSFPGVRVLRRGNVELARSTLSNVGGTGVLAAGGANLVISEVIIEGSGESGIHLSGDGSAGSVTASFRGVRSRGNKSNGVLCDGSTTLSNVESSQFTGNEQSGFVIGGSCNVTFAASGNLFNRTGAKNANAGLCVTSPASVDAPGSTFSCGYSGSGCDGSGTLSPTRMTSSTCASGADISAASGAVVTSLSPMCCQ